MSIFGSPARAQACAILLLLAAPVAAKAQAASELSGVVVTATRTPVPAIDVGSSLSVVTADDIAAQRWRTLPEALNATPGLNVVQTGGPGGQTSVFIRGTNSDHVKVLIDGVEANDPSAGDAFDFGQVLLGDVERIEVLRGPSSGLYGSDAIGGVVNIITRPAGGRMRGSAMLEGGSFGTFDQSANVSGSAGPKLGYAFDVAHLRAADTAVTPSDLLAPGEARNGDSYDNLTLSGRLHASPSAAVGLGATVRYTDTHLAFTGEDYSVFPAIPAAAQSFQEKRELFASLSGDARVDGWLKDRATLGYTAYRTREKDPDTAYGPTPASYARGDRIDVADQAEGTLARGATLVGGAELKSDRLQASPITATDTDRAGFLELEAGPAEGLSAAASVRYDSYAQVGARATYRVAPVFAVAATGTRLKASYGTGFKAPSLSQLFVSYPAFGFHANPDLKPERSRGYDIGFEQALPGDWASVGATYFRNDIDDLIDASADGSTYVNVDRARTYGVESFAAAKLGRRLDVRLNYTYTVAKDAETGLELPRRPRNRIDATAEWRPTSRLSAAMTALYVGSRVDGNRDFTIPRLRAPPYFTVDLAAAYRLGRTLEFFARVENLLDRHYEDPVGFMRPRAGGFAGVRVRLGR